MAIDLTLKSVQITARDASPPTMSSPGVGGVSDLKRVSGYIASVTASLSITSVIRMLQVPAHAYVKSVRIYSAAQAAGAFDVGLYRNTADGGAVVDQDFFATAVSCASAVEGTEISNESGTYTVAKRIKPLWDAAGMSTEPAKGTMLDIACVVATTDVTTGTGALLLEVDYVM